MVNVISHVTDKKDIFYYFGFMIKSILDQTRLHFLTVYERHMNY